MVAQVMLPDDDRKHLTSKEVERLLQATRGARHEARDRCLVLVTFRHGLRVTELCRLKLDRWTSTPACCTSSG